MMDTCVESSSRAVATPSFVNIAGYRFIDFDDWKEWRAALQELCHNHGIKGTVLLSENGINFFLAGSESAVKEYICFIEKDERFREIPLKVSHSSYQPFRRMLVKLKKEIISLGLDEIRPAVSTGERISPTEFKQMLDNGEEVVILDTRNDYETRVGKFENAVELDITTFRQFPEAANELPEEYRNKTVVMYCTGGIRCEKASAVMINQGFSDVRQLDGGILGYFEECGGAHWEGDCFVFDQRVSLRDDLEEGDFVLCFNCRNPLSLEEQQSEQYVIEKHCPYCIEGLVE